MCVHCGGVDAVCLLPRAHAPGVMQSVCMSVVVVVVRMKIAGSGDLGILTCCNNYESVDIGCFCTLEIAEDDPY